MNLTTMAKLRTCRLPAKLACVHPGLACRAVVAKLIECNNAARLELDWQGQYEAILDGRRLVRHHADVLKAGLHEFIRAATPSVDQLRSSTVKAALLLFQELFNSLGRAMDRELDEVTPALLKKAGEVSNAGRDTFLAQESDRALSEMVRCASEARAASALIACANHKSAHVRVKVASHLDELMEAACSGASGGRTPLANNWTTLERIFKTAAGFLDEGSLETRTYGKRIIWHIKSTVGNRTDFERLVMSVSPAPLQKKVVDVVEGSNGPPPPPSRGPGASRMVRSGSGAPPSPARALREQYSAGSGGGYVTAGMGGANGLSAGPLSSAPLPTGRYAPASAPTQMGGSSSSALPGDAGRMGRRGSRGPARDGLDGIPESAAGTGAPGGAAGGRFLRSLSSSRQETTNGSLLPSFPAGAWPSAAGEALSKALSSLAAKDFRERTDALRGIEALAPALTAAPDTALVQAIDGMVGRLSDPNAKVNILALDTLGIVVACLAERSSVGLNSIVPALAANLGSTNDKVRSVASRTADALTAAVDPALLVQNFSHCVSNGHSRGKPAVVDKLCGIIMSLHPVKPHLVTKYAVPATLSLLNEGRGDSKAAGGQLLGTLAALMGNSLLSHTGGLSPALQARVVDAVTMANQASGGRI